MSPRWKFWKREAVAAPTEPIGLNTEGWKCATNEAGQVVYEKGDDMLIAFSFEVPPDIPVALDELSALRAFYREQIVESGSGLISLEVVDIDGVPSVALITKTPMQPTGMFYLASVTIPFRDCSYVVKAHCPEVGTTGMREASLVFQIADELGCEPGDDSWAETWTRDPYEPTHRSDVMRNLAEDERWDGDFPNHPLSRARSHLRHLQESTRVSDELKSTAAFTGG